MGRYVYGTAGFSYKYVFASQPSNLGQLADWAGFGHGTFEGAISTQFYAPYTPQNAEQYEPVDGVGMLTQVYQTTIPGEALGLRLPNDIESAIYKVCDQWADVVQRLEAMLPGPALNPDLAIVATFDLQRDQWAQLAERIGHGADIADRESLLEARDIVFDSAEDEYLPLLAVNALLHAIDNDLDELQLVDGDRTETNLWSVAQDYMFHDPPKTFAQREAASRVLAYDFAWDQAEPAMRELLEENPNAFRTARMLFGRHIWNDDWEGMAELAKDLLGRATSNEAVGEYHRWLGEAYWALDELDAVTDPAEAAAALGRPELLNHFTTQRAVAEFAAELAEKLEPELEALEANDPENERIWLLADTLNRIEDGMLNICPECWGFIPLDRLREKPLEVCADCEDDDD